MPRTFEAVVVSVRRSTDCDQLRKTSSRGAAIATGLTAVVAALLAVFVNTANAQDRTYGGFDCTVDCSGHAAGYKWADDHNITDELDCPDGNSQSFHEGCVAYAQDNLRPDPDEDDDRKPVGAGSDDDDDDK